MPGIVIDSASDRPYGPTSEDYEHDKWVQEQMETNGPSAQAQESAQTKENSCDEVTDLPAHEQKVTAEQVSPAVSLPISPSTDENYKIESDGNQRSNQSGTGNGKPDCYKCKHRRGLSYSTHSECKHPALDGKGRVLAIACIMTGGQFPPFNLKGNAHGIRSGWFAWPLDYDPVWLDSCDAFEQVEKRNG